MTGARRFLTGCSSFAVMLLAVVAAAGASRPPSALAADCNKNADPGTLQGIVNGAQSGDVICMAPGVYRGPLTFTNVHGVTLHGAGPRVSILTGVDKDSMLVFGSSDLVFENFTLFYGHPSDAYINGSKNVLFRNMDVGGGGIGIHYDVNSTGRISDSFVYAIEGDAIAHPPRLERDRRAQLDLRERRRRRLDGRPRGDDDDHAEHHLAQRGAGRVRRARRRARCCRRASSRCRTATSPTCRRTSATRTSSSTATSCRRAAARASSCSRARPARSRATASGRTTCTGMFVWGASITSESDDFWANDEHAIEFRAYPDPLKYGQVGKLFPVRAVGRINHATIHDTVVLPESGRLGGGVLGQGANMDVSNSLIWGNRGIGVSYVNTSLGSIDDNAIVNNGGSAICIYKAGNVTTDNNIAFGNADDTVGVCHETTP